MNLKTRVNQPANTATTIAPGGDCMALAPVGNLEAYLNWTQTIPVLSKEEESELIDRLFKQGDVSAAKKLILSHLRFVVFVSRSFLGYGLSHEDLIQEGNIGLMKALKRFDPTVGVRLVSFAVHWIRSEMQEFILKNWRIVKRVTTKTARKLFFKKQQVSQSMSREDMTFLSKTLNVSVQDIRDMQARLSSSNDVSFDPTEQGDSSTAPSAYLSAPENTCLETQYIAQATQKDNHQKLEFALSSLDSRLADIVRKRWLNDSKLTLHELAAEYGVSAERVRQLEKTAMAKLKLAIAGPA